MQHRSNRKHTKAFTFMLSLGMLASVLIWAKLRLITDIPRSALAEPKEHELLHEAIDEESLPDIETGHLVTHDGSDAPMNIEDSGESVSGDELEQEPLSDP